MKRFRFSLERVLEFRLQQEAAERGRLAALVAERRRLEGQAEEMLETSAQARRAVLGAGLLEAAELLAAHHYAGSLLRHREAALAAARAVEQERRAQLGQVLEARRRVRLLERLRERRKREHTRQAEGEWEAAAGELHQARQRREAQEKSLDPPREAR